jgi:integral membrane sensor domain MASE1
MSELVVGTAEHSRSTRVSHSANVLRGALAALLVFAGYYVGARVGFALTFQPHPVSTLWPPDSTLFV